MSFWLTVSLSIYIIFVTVCLANKCTSQCFKKNLRS